MKLIKKIMSIIALLSITGYSVAYEYGITNLSKFVLLIKIQEKAGSSQYKIVPSNTRIAFSFGGANCLESIYGEIHNPELGLKDSEYPVRNIPIYMEPKPVYDATVKAAKELVEGLEVLGCKTLETALKFLPEGQAILVADKIAKSGGSGGKGKQCQLGLAIIAKAAGELKGITLCKSREFVIMPTGDKVKNAFGAYLEDYIALTVKGE